MDSETKRETEIDKEFNRINENIESLISIIQSVEAKLNPLLIPERPTEEITSETEIEPNTEIGRKLRDLSNKILKESNNIMEIIDRLEI